MSKYDVHSVRATFPDWSITFEYGYWTAVHKDFEASWEGEEDGYVGNGLNTTARDLEGLAAEIECIIAEHPHFKEPANENGQ